MSTLIPVGLRCEYLENPVVDILNPRLSWRLEPFQKNARALRQTAYQIFAATSNDLLSAGKPDLWDSGKVMSDEMVVSYSGIKLMAEQEVFWKVRVWDQADVVSEFSQPSCFQVGLLGRVNWRWIGDDRFPFDENGTAPSPYLRRSFILKEKVRRAVVYATALGLYELFINGNRVGDALLTPGWTDYHKHLQYQAYDISTFLQIGENVIGAILGDGWCSGKLGWNPTGGAYEKRPALLLSLRIELESGKKTIISSGPGWKSSSGAILRSNIYHGETCDARLEPAGWAEPGFNDMSWQPATIYSKKTRKLAAQPCPSIRVTQEIKPISIRQVQPGVFLYDMGQNMVGWARLHVQGPAGTRVKMRFIEVLNPDGTVYTENLRKACQTDVYILSGKGNETFEPHFTYHGFRYVEVSGFPGTPDLDSLVGLVFHSDLPMVGDFSCSNPDVNRLVENIRWSQRGNFMAVPTDCPQRDERLGWTGDANLFARTATYNMDCASYFTKWMIDLRNGQARNGAYPDVAPKIVVMKDGAPAWGDIAIGLPWVMYQVYGDLNLINEYYPSMQRWMEYIQAGNPNMLRKNRLNNNYGDWVPMDPHTPKDLLATAFWAFDARAMMRMATALGKHEDAKQYQNLYEAIRKAFQEEYTKDTNILHEWYIRGDTQTAYALALVWDLLLEEQRSWATYRLVSDIYRRGLHLSTGFIGTAFLLPALSDNGYNDLAYQLLLQDTFPSWIYPIRKGATTIWERWDSYTDHLGFQTPNMNSFNHFALGTVGEWLFRYVAGIDTDLEQVGYKKVIIRPRPGKGLDWVKARYQSIRGEIRSEWTKSEDGIRLDVSIPPNTTAEIHLPGAARAKEAEGAAFLRVEDGNAVYLVGSGDYTVCW